MTLVMNKMILNLDRASCITIVKSNQTEEYSVQIVFDKTCYKLAGKTKSLDEAEALFDKIKNGILVKQDLLEIK